MDLDLERVALGSAVGVTVPQSPPGKRERHQQINNSLL